MSVDAGGIERALDVNRHAHRLCRNDSRVRIDDSDVRVGSHDKRLRLYLRGQRPQRDRRCGQEHVRAVSHAGKQQKHETNDEQRGDRHSALLAWLAAFRGDSCRKNGRVEGGGRSAGDHGGRQHLGVRRWFSGARMFSRHRSVDPLVEPPILLAKGRERPFGYRYRVVGRQPGRYGEGADLRLVADSDDVHPPLSRLAREQLEIDARRRDFRAGRNDEDRVRVRRRADAADRGRYLVVGLDIDGGHHKPAGTSALRGRSPRARGSARRASCGGRHRLDLHLAQHAAQRGVERRLGRAHLERLVASAIGVMSCSSTSRPVASVTCGDLLDLDRFDLRRPGKRQVLGQGSGSRNAAPICGRRAPPPHR